MIQKFIKLVASISALSLMFMAISCSHDDSEGELLKNIVHYGGAYTIEEGSESYRTSFSVSFLTGDQIQVLSITPDRKRSILYKANGFSSHEEPGRGRYIITAEFVSAEITMLTERAVTEANNNNYYNHRDWEPNVTKNFTAESVQHYGDKQSLYARLSISEDKNTLTCDPFCCFNNDLYSQESKVLTYSTLQPGQLSGYSFNSTNSQKQSSETKNYQLKDIVKIGSYTRDNLFLPNSDLLTFSEDNTFEEKYDSFGENNVLSYKYKIKSITFDGFRYEIKAELISATLTALNDDMELVDGASNGLSLEKFYAITGWEIGQPKDISEAIEKERSIAIEVSEDKNIVDFYFDKQRTVKFEWVYINNN